MANSIGEELASILRSNLSETFLLDLGSTWIVDNLNLFVISPLAFVGFVFNLLSFTLLAINKTINSVTLYRFIIAYAFNNTFICLILSSSFASLSARYFVSSLFFSTYARIHRCVLFHYVTTTLYFVGKLLEILIICDRLANFNMQPFKRLLVAFSSLRNIPFVYAACALINLPYHFYRQAKTDDQLVNDLAGFNRTHTIYYCQRAAFMSTSIGMSLIYVALFLRDCLTLGTEIVLSIGLVVTFRRFLANKLVICPRTLNLNIRPLAVASVAIPVANREARSKSFRKTTFVISNFAIFSILANTCTLALYMIITVSYVNLVTVYVLFLTMLVMITKPFVTIFVIVKLDKNFKFGHLLRGIGRNRTPATSRRSMPRLHRVASQQRSSPIMNTHMRSIHIAME